LAPPARQSRFHHLGLLIEQHGVVTPRLEFEPGRFKGGLRFDRPPALLQAGKKCVVLLWIADEQDAHGVFLCVEPRANSPKSYDHISNYLSDDRRGLSSQI